MTPQRGRRVRKTMKKENNVLFILCDQFKQDIPGFNGNTIVQTPHLDKLSEISTNFVNAHTICPLCSPARGALLSGLEPNLNGVIDNLLVGASQQQPLGEVIDTWLKAASTNGFTTGYFGKWHLGKWDYASRKNITFDMSAPEFVDSRKNKGARATAHGELKKHVIKNEMIDWNRDGHLDSQYKMPFYGKLESEEGMRDYATCRKAISFLNQTKDDTPWCCTASFKSPHFPLGIPEPYYSMYDWRKIALPDNFRDNFQNKPWFQNRHWWPLITDRFTDDDWRKTIAAYYGLVSLTDHWIGQVLEAAKQHTHGRKTTVIFTADHGEMLGAHSRFDKAAYFYEEVMRVPLLVCKDLGGVGVKKEVRSEYTSTLDTSKTLYHLLGSEGYKGRDLCALMDGTSQDEWNPVSFAEYHRYNAHLFELRMITTPSFKYCFNPQDIDELYDLKNDKEELYNVSDNEAYAEIKETLKNTLIKHLQANNDSILQSLDSIPPAGCVM